jgi:hypothetical protein
MIDKAAFLCTDLGQMHTYTKKILAEAFLTKDATKSEKLKN